MNILIPLKTKMKIVGIIIFAFITPWLHGQQIWPPKIKFSIDSTIRPAIDQSIAKGEYAALPTLDLQMFVNNEEVINTFEKEKKVQFLTQAYYERDTLYILGFIGMFSGVGFYLDLYGDSSRVTLYATTDGPEVYKLNETDTTYQRGLSVPAKSCNLTLTKVPEYMEGEIVEGLVTLDSREFYSKSHKEQRDDKIQAKISAYFRTEPIHLPKK